MKYLLINIRSFIGLSVIVVFVVCVIALLVNSGILTTELFAAIGVMLGFGFLGYCVIGFFESGFPARKPTQKNNSITQDGRIYESHTR